MKTQFYLKINSKGAVNTTKTKPYLGIDEVAVLVNVELPDILFKKPQITANIHVDAENVTPFTIDANTLSDVKEAIQVATGMNITLAIQPEIE